MLIKIWKKKTDSSWFRKDLSRYKVGSPHSRGEVPAVPSGTPTGELPEGRASSPLVNSLCYIWNNKESCGCRSSQPVMAFPSMFSHLPWCVVAGRFKDFHLIFFRQFGHWMWRFEGWEVEALWVDCCFLPSLKSSWNRGADQKRGKWEGKRPFWAKSWRAAATVGEPKGSFGEIKSQSEKADERKREELSRYRGEFCSQWGGEVLAVPCETATGGVSQSKDPLLLLWTHSKLYLKTR